MARVKADWLGHAAQLLDSIYEPESYGEAVAKARIVAQRLTEIYEQGYRRGKEEGDGGEE